MSNAMETWITSAQDVVSGIAHTQHEAIDRVAHVSAGVISAGDRVHLFGTGHSRIAVEEMFPRYGSYPGFHGIVELSATTYAGVSGANGLLQAMHIERQHGLADVILQSHALRAGEALIVFSVSGANAVPVEMLQGAQARGLTTIAVTSLAHIEYARAKGVPTLLDHADHVIDLCVPPGDAAVAVGDQHVGPTSTLAYVTVVNLLKVRTAELLSERGALPPVITHASIVGAEPSLATLVAAVEDHARRQRRTP